MVVAVEWLQQNWLVALGAAANLAAIATFLIDRARGRKWRLRKIWTRITAATRSEPTPPATPEGLRIVVSHLVGDTDRMQTKNLCHQLRTSLGSETVGSPYEVDLARRTIEHPDTITPETRASLEAEIDAVLTRWNADVVLYGEIGPGDRRMRLHFGHYRGARTDLKQYDLTEAYDLPQDFHADLAHAIVARAIALEADADGRNEFVADRMRLVARRLERIAAQPPDGLSDLDRARIMRAYGKALYWIGAQTDETDKLEDAITAFEAARDLTEQEDAPPLRARILIDLGFTLSFFGDRQAGTGAYARSMEAHTAAEAILTPEDQLLLWSKSLRGRAGTAGLSFHRQGGDDLLQDAKAACERALEHVTLENLPEEWASLKGTIATTFLHLGRARQDNLSYQRAIEAYTSALQIHTLDNRPRDWARVQGNLAICHYDMAFIDTNPDLMQTAVDHYENALQVYTPERHLPDWSKNSVGLADALRVLGGWQRDQSLLLRALGLMTSVAHRIDKSRNPVEWARANRTKATLLVNLGRNRGGAHRLDEAQDALTKALEVFNLEATPIEYGLTLRDLGSLSSARYLHSRDPADLDRAETFTRNADTLFESHQRASLLESTRNRLDEIVKQRAEHAP